MQRRFRAQSWAANAQSCHSAKNNCQYPKCNQAAAGSSSFIPFPRGRKVTLQWGYLIFQWHFIQHRIKESQNRPWGLTQGSVAELCQFCPSPTLLHSCYTFPLHSCFPFPTNDLPLCHQRRAPGIRLPTSDQHCPIDSLFWANFIAWQMLTFANVLYSMFVMVHTRNDLVHQAQ